MPRPDGTPTTADRGYGAAHQRRARAAKLRAVGTPCPVCGGLMTSVALMDYDHEIPLVLDPTGQASRVTCRKCNRRAGQRLGQARRRRRAALIRLVTSQRW